MDRISLIKSKGVVSLLIAFLSMGSLFPAEYAPREKRKQESQPATTELAELQAELNDMKAQLGKSIRAINSLAKKVNRLEQEQRNAADLQGRRSRIDSVVTAHGDVIDELARQVSDLEKRLLRSKQRALYSDSINYEILSQLVILENRIVSLSSSLNESRTVQATITPQTSPNTPASYKDKYLRGLALHRDGQNEAAITLFRQLLAEDRHHDLADNAQYWIGECYYSMKQYQRSINEFEKVFSFRNTNKDDDAQFKLGLCYLALDDREQALEHFQRLIDYYPQSEYVPKAQKFVN